MAANNTGVAESGRVAEFWNTLKQTAEGLRYVAGALGGATLTLLNPDLDFSPAETKQESEDANV